MTIYYTIYKTINLFNGKYYIGKHQTIKINDCYLGSGLVLERAIKKYGRKNFRKDILFVFDNEEEMNEKEIELITEEIVNDENSYNMRLGGEGGAWNGLNWHTSPRRDEIIENIKKKLVGIKRSEEFRLGRMGKKNGASKRQRIVCIHCGIVCDASNYGRWHGDNCRRKVKINNGS